jgi:hypothetical protein
MFDTIKQVTLEETVKETQYRKVDNLDKSIQMNYWDCGENSNNDVYKTPEGGIQYRKFTLWCCSYFISQYSGKRISCIASL